MVLSQSERISQLLDNSRKFVSRNKVRDSSELHLIHQAKGSHGFVSNNTNGRTTLPQVVKATADPHSLQLMPPSEEQKDCAATVYYTGVGTGKDQTALLYNKQKAAICADDDPAWNPYIILPIPKCANIIPVVKPDYGGSLYFDGAAGTNLEIPPNNTDFTIDNGENFTIEWFQYMEDNQNYARIFSIGPAIERIGFSIEYDSDISPPDYHVYFWVVNGDNENAYIRTSLSASQLYNKWNHIAIDRYNGRTEIFFNGAYLSSVDGDYNVTNADNYNLIIGDILGGSGNIGTFKGYITNFRWTKGVSVYESTDFTVPTKPLPALPNTVLLLDVSSSDTATQDTSGLSQSVTNNNVVYNYRNPFN